MNYIWQLFTKPHYEWTLLDSLLLLALLFLPFILWNWRLFWEAFKEWRANANRPTD